MAINRIRQEYVFPEWDYSAFAALIERAMTGIDQTLYEWASATTRSRPEAALEFESIAEWRQHVEKEWAGLARLQCRQSADRGRLVVYVDRDEATLEITVETAAAADGDALLAELERALGAKRKPKLALQESRGVRRRYFIDDPLTSGSFDKLVDFLRAEAARSQPRITARARYNTGDAQTFHQIDAWRTEVLRSWRDLTEVSFHTWKQDNSFDLTCDIWRQLLTLEIEATDPAEVPRLSEALKQLLSLSPAPERPYQYRRFANFYKIRKWTSNKEVADAIRRAIDKAYKTPPALVDGFITYGGAEELLHPAHSLPELLALAADDRTYDQLKFYLEGGQGMALGVVIDRRKSRAEFRSSLNPTRFDDVIESLKDALSLKLELALAPGDDEPPKTDSRLMKVVAAVGFAVLSLISIESIKHYSAEDKLVITFPSRGAENADVAVTTPTVHVHWVVRRVRAGNSKDVYPTPEGVVQLLDASGKVLLNKRGPSAVEIPFPPMDGSYALVVEIPELRKSEMLRVTKTSAVK